MNKCGLERTNKIRKVWCGLHKMQEGNWVSKCQMKDDPVFWRIHLSERFHLSEVKDLWTQKQDSYILERRKTSPDLLTVVCKTYKQQWCIKDHILELPALVMSSWNTDKTPPSFSSTASCAQTVPICTNTMILFPAAAPSVATPWLNSCLSHPEDLQHNHVYTSHPCALELDRQADSGTAFQQLYLLMIQSQVPVYIHACAVSKIPYKRAWLF